MEMYVEQKYNVIQELKKYIEVTQNRWNKYISQYDKNDYNNFVLMSMRFGLKSNKRKYNYENPSSFDTISNRIVFIDEVYYISNYPIWTLPYSAEINVESEDKYRDIGYEFGFSDETLDELYLELLKDDHSNVYSIKNVRTYLREHMDLEENLIISKQENTLNKV